MLNINIATTMLSRLSSSPIIGFILRVIMLAGVFLCACHSASKHAVISTRDEYNRLGRMAHKGIKPRWNGSQWRRYYYIKTLVLVSLLFILELWAVVRSQYLTFGIIVVTVLIYLDHTMITWLEATSGAVYDNHRQGRIIKIKSLHISIYPRAFAWMMPVVIIGIVLILMIDILFIFLFATVIFGTK